MILQSLFRQRVVCELTGIVSEMQAYTLYSGPEKLVLH